MKTPIIAIASIISTLAFASAGEIKAPNNGRIIESVTPHAELLITPEKKVEIRFLDDAGKVIAPAEQVVTIIMGDRSAPTRLAFAKEGDKLVSDKTIPEGKSLPLVLQIRAKAGEKATTEKFNLNLANCPECSHPEYACTCDHSGAHEGHDH